MHKIQSQITLPAEQMLIKAQEEKVRMSIYDFATIKKHHSLAASIVASPWIRKQKIQEAVSAFQNVEHRMEHVASVRGIDFINDSKSTNVNCTWYALESVNKPIVLILGGIDKGNDYSIITELVRDKVKAIVCLGTNNKKITRAFKNVINTIIETDNAGDAIHTAFTIAVKGDAVLLSPACASFDLFKNYDDRGRKFKAIVKDL